MKVLLHDNSLNLRGTSVAVYDYAIWLKKIYNIDSYISYFKNDFNNHNSIIKKFAKHFQLIPLNSSDDIDKEIIKNQIDVFYAIKSGAKDKIFTSKCKTAIHAVFPSSQVNAHGDVYAYVSEWLAKECSNNILPYVPHMLDLPVLDKNDNFRNQLNIPQNAIVFGRYGGLESFDVPFVHRVIEKIVNENSEIYFLFCNTHKFINHPRVIFTNSVTLTEQKVKFINTCDAMLHARQRGETFGLSILEFMSQNKPVFTYGSSPEQNHFILLDKQGYIYNNEEELYSMLLNFLPHTINYKQINSLLPDKVIQKFHDVFIK